MELYIKKCNKCGSIVLSFNKNSVKWCDEEMINLKTNGVDASFEKHIPNYEINGNKITISVNHVMEEKHYIKFIIMKTDNELFYKELKYNEEAKVTFDYKGKCEIYSYCNLHGLWINKVE